jgi:hypothetical protein
MNIKYVLALLVGVLFIFTLEDAPPLDYSQDDMYSPYENKSIEQDNNCN